MDNAAKVEQFLLLAKNARGLALADLIGKATAEPGLFTFGEIMSMPAAQEVGAQRGGEAGKAGERRPLLKAVGGGAPVLRAQEPALPATCLPAWPPAAAKRRARSSIRATTAVCVWHLAGL